MRPLEEESVVVLSENDPFYHSSVFIEHRSRDEMKKGRRFLGTVAIRFGHDRIPILIAMREQSRAFQEDTYTLSGRTVRIESVRVGGLYLFEVFDE